MNSLLQTAVEKFKHGYFFFEDKYYSLLDKIDKHVPIYKMVDPIDRAVPSFALLIAAILFLAIFFIFLSTITTALTATLQVVDNKGNAIENVLINLDMDGQVQDISTDDWGEAILAIPAQEVEAEANFSKEGFQDLERTVFLTANEIASVTMQPEIPSISLENAEKTIKVVDSSTNRAIRGVTLSFECVSGGFAPHDQKGDTGEFKVIQPSNCPTLVATADAFGYTEKSTTLSSSTTYIRLTADVEDTTGSITVIVRDQAGNPEPNVTVRALDGTTGLVNASSATTLSGTALLKELQPGSYTVSASAQDGRTGQESGVLVTAGESTTVTIILPNADDVETKKIYLKLVEQGTTNPVANAQAFIYENNDLVDSTTSDSLGIVEKRLTNLDSTYNVVLSHPEFITKVKPDVPLRELSNSEPITVPMVRSSMEEPNPTSAKIIATVVDEDGEPVEDALITIYDSAYPEIPLKTPPGKTLEDGTYPFANLAPGTYFAKAEDEDGRAEGRSDPVTIAAGETIELQVMLVLGAGWVEATVFDADSASKDPIAGAEVQFIDAFDGTTVLVTCTTIEGKCESEPISADKEVFVKASASGFMPGFATSTIDIINKNKASVEIGLIHESSIPSGIRELETRFVAFCSDKACEGLVGKIQSDEAGTLTYFAKFELIFAEDASYSDIVQHVRAGPDLEIDLPMPFNYKIKIMGVTGPLLTAAPLSKCWNNDPVNPFTEPADCSTTADAKQANIYYPDLEGKQIVPFVVEFDVESGLASGEKLEMHYIAKATVAEEEIVTANKIKFFLIDDFLCEDKDIAWSFLLENPDGSTTVLDSSASNELTMNQSYSLLYSVYNCSGRNLSSAEITAQNGSPEAISFTSVEPFDFGPKSLQSFSFPADTELSYSQPIFAATETPTAELEFRLTTQASEIAPSIETLEFSIESSIVLSVEHMPSKLSPILSSQSLVGTVTATGPVGNATVTLKIGDSAVMTTTTGSTGSFSISGISGLEGLSSVTLTVRAAGYKTFEKQIEVGTDPPIPNPDLDCISIEKDGSDEVNIHFIKPSGTGIPSDTFFVINGCDASVLIHLESELQTLPSDDFTLPAGSSRQVTVIAETAVGSAYPIYMGEYGVNVKAKLGSVETADPMVPFAGPIQTARIYVTDPNSSFRLADPADHALMKSSFDIRGDTDEGLIINKNFYYFEDLSLPRIDKVHDYSAVEELFSLLYSPPTQPGVEKQRQKVDFSFGEDYFTEQVAFNEGGNLFINLVDSGGYVFVNWIDLLMTDEEHNGGDRHRIWAQISRDSWSNVTSELPYTPSTEPKEPPIKKIVANSNAAYLRGLSSDQPSGDGWHKVYEGTIDQLRMPFPTIDNDGMVDVDTYYPEDGKFTEDITNDPMWQGQHNVCNSNLTGFDSVLAGCSVDRYRSGAVSIPYAIGHIANTIAVESEGGSKISAAKWSYISTDKDHEGLIEFSIRNNTLMGEEYALIEVEDSIGASYVIGSRASEDITFDYLVTKKGTLVTNSEIKYQPSPSPLELDDGDILAVSVEGSSQVFSSLSLDSASDLDTIYAALQPASPKQVTAITLKSNDETDDFEMERNPFGPPYIKYRIYSNGSWSTTSSFFDIGPAEVGTADEFWTGSEASQIEMIAFENLSDTTVEIDQIIMDYTIREEKQVELDWTTVTIRLGQESVENDLPPDMALPVAVGNYEDVRYVLSEDSEYAIVAFSDTGGPSSEDPYGSDAKIIAFASTPEQESQKASEKFHIRLIGQSQDQCIQGDTRGSTGPGAKPRVLLDWSWGAIEIDSCNSDNPDFIYCDPTQFSISLIKRLDKMRQLAEEDLTGNLLELREMQDFKAYLIEDAYTTDFREDFVESFSREFLSDELTNPQHPWGEYVLDQERFVFETGESSKLVEAGLHHVFIGLEFDPDQDQFDFFYVPGGDQDVGLLANINVELVQISEPVIKSPFYYLPFNGDVGFNPETSEFHRQDYGLEFDNHNGPLTVVSSPLGISFKTDSSTGRKLVQTEKISDFDSVNIIDRGILLKISQDQVEIKFSPSIATPILLEMKPFEAQVEAYYWLRDTDGDIPVSGSSLMNLWTGTGSTMRSATGNCVDYYGSKLEYQIPDMIPPTGSCASSMPGSYGFRYNPASDDQLYFETVFFVPESLGINLRKSCPNEESLSVFYSPGDYYTGDDDDPVPLSLSDSITRVASMEHVINLVSDEYICISSDSDYFSFWWNPQKVLQDLDEVKQGIQNWDDIACNVMEGN